MTTDKELIKIIIKEIKQKQKQMETITTDKNYKLQFCNNTFNYILFKANYFDSGNISFWHEVDRAIYLKPLIKRNNKHLKH